MITGFNGAAHERARKRRAVGQVSITSMRFNGAAHERARKHTEEPVDVDVEAVLQWGRARACAETGIVLSGVGIFIELQWGRARACAETRIYCLRTLFISGFNGAAHERARKRVIG